MWGHARHPGRGLEKKEKKKKKREKDMQGAALAWPEMPRVTVYRRLDSMEAPQEYRATSKDL